MERYLYLAFAHFDSDGNPTGGEGHAAEEPDANDRSYEWLPQPEPIVRALKRAIDIGGALCALVVLLPVFLLVCAAVKLSSPGPVFFGQTRMGLHGKPFRFLKFRSMVLGSDKRSLDKLDQYVENVISDARRSEGGPVYKLSNDPRVTNVGRFLRRTSLDELPQFINVLVGDMSLVGPRPPIAYEVQAYDKWHMLRLSCKPGITGLWQVQTDKKYTFDEMVQLDLTYIKNLSIKEDFRILFETPRAVFSPYV